MINIGFDDDEVVNEEEDKKEGDKSKRERKLDFKIPQRRIEQLKAQYDCVVVNDFGDEYHLSEEERQAKNRFYEAFKKFSKFKHKYRTLPEFVEAMREALKCLDFVAENNGVYDPEEFKKKFMRGKIYINGLTFPEFKGREKKSISWEYLTEFILSDEEPENILPKKHEEILTEDEMEDLETVLFTKEEFENIIRSDTEEEAVRKEMFFDVDEDKPDIDTAIFLDQKQSKKFLKDNPDFIFEIKEMKRETSGVNRLERLAHDLTLDDIEAIARYDRLHNYKSESEMPEFKGDLTNDKDYHKYLQDLDEWEKSNIKENYNGKLKTLEEIEELELKLMLERHNWNIRNLYENKDKEAKLRKIQKKEKKRERELKKKLLDVQNRRKRRMGEDINSKKKKKGKNKKSKNKKEID